MNKREGSFQSQQLLITIICVLGLTFMLFRVNILAHSLFLYRIEYLCAIRQLIIWVCNETARDWATTKDRQRTDREKSRMLSLNHKGKPVILV